MTLKYEEISYIGLLKEMFNLNEEEVKEIFKTEEEVVDEEKSSSKIGMYYKHFKKLGYDLIDVTGMLTSRVNTHGIVNDFKEPDSNIYHVELLFRDELVAIVDGESVYTVNKNFVTYEDEGFIVFRKIPNPELLKKGGYDDHSL